MSASEPLLFGYSDPNFWSRFVRADDSFSVAPRGPFQLELDARIRAYVAATNGYVLVAVPEREASGLPSSALASPGSAMRRDVAKLLSEAPSYQRRQARAGALLEWCGEPLWPSGGPCPQCGPRPEKEECDACGGSGEHECTEPACADVHDCGVCDGSGYVQPRSCRLCDGTGKEKWVPARGGYLLGTSVDRVLLGRVVDALAERSSSVVEIAATPGRLEERESHALLWISCGDRRGAVLPYRGGGPSFTMWLDAAERG